MTNGKYLFTMTYTYFPIYSEPIHEPITIIQQQEIYSLIHKRYTKIVGTKSINSTKNYKNFRKK